MARSNLWAPWRIDFMRSLNHGGGDENPSTTTPGHAAETFGDSGGGGGSGCFLCDALVPDASADALSAQHVLHRTPHAVLMMNRYPYVNGHLLVAPAGHVTDLTDLPPEQRHAVTDLIDLGARALKRAMNCQGYNAGCNVGRCAGAAVPGHVHAHVVPRWHGDTNFMEVLGATKVIPQALDDCYADLTRAVQELTAQ